jgi:hypothetical protein
MSGLVNLTVWNTCTTPTGNGRRFHDEFGREIGRVVKTSACQTRSSCSSVVWPLQPSNLERGVSFFKFCHQRLETWL